MTDVSFEEIVEDRQFAGILQTHAEVFFRLSNTLLAAERWNKKHYFQLINETEALESFLDDYGARYNGTYVFLTEIVASLRGFAQTGYSITHLEGRLSSYGSDHWNSTELGEAHTSTARVKTFLAQSVRRLLQEARSEAQRLGVEITPEAFPESNFMPVVARRRLSRNLGQADLVNEEQKIAEVATKYLQACERFQQVGIRRLEEPDQRRDFLNRVCTEEQARTYEANVHNLQSTYDTHVQNTVLESKDDRLPQIRGHISAALHLLEAVTYLTHFAERHEDQIRSEEAKHRIGEMISAEDVQDVTLNELLVWANWHLQTASPLAEALLPEYTNVQDLEVRMDDTMTFHARPASLIVGIVNHYGTPVEMELGGQRSNAASILELLVAAGSYPEERNFTFRGDERPLRDIRILFEAGLGEKGIERLPSELSYLRSSN